MREFNAADWSVHPTRNVIVRDADEVHLEPRVMDLLVYLAGRAGEVLSRDQIIAAVWPETYVGDDALLTAISSLRKAFGDDARRPAFVETIPKRGYRFIAPTSAGRALAVLPFQNFSDDVEDDFFADGMTEAIISELGRMQTLRVISRQSVMAYRASDKPIAQIGRELNAGLIVEGSVLRSQGRVRISTQLIEVDNDHTLWAETYEGDLEDVLKLQREAAATIAVGISDRLRPVTRDIRAEKVHPDAIIACMRGRYHFWKFSPEHFARALEYFHEALSIDPNLAPAHAGIADVWGAFAYWGMLPPAEVRDHVREAVNRALEADPSNPEAELLSATYHFFFDRDFPAAESGIRRAIDLNPNLAHARVINALYLSTLKRPEAIDEINLAVRLDPLNPAPLLVRAMLLAARGRREEAEQEIDNLLEIEPHHPPALLLRADLHWIEGAADAIEWERAGWMGDADVAAALAGADSAEGARAAVKAAARVLIDRAAQVWVQPTQIARLLVHARETDAALDWLERAAIRGELIQIDSIRLSSAWDPIRSRPRFAALFKQLGLPT